MKRGERVEKGEANQGVSSDQEGAAQVTRGGDGDHRVERGTRGGGGTGSTVALRPAPGHTGAPASSLRERQIPQEGEAVPPASSSGEEATTLPQKQG